MVCQLTIEDMISDTVTDAHARALASKDRGELLSDVDIDALVLSWQVQRLTGDPVEYINIVVEALTNMVMKATGRRKGWLSHRTEEIRLDARLWVLETLAEYRDGEGSAAAFVSSRTEWAVSNLIRTHGQGAGIIDAPSYQVRAAAWAERDRLREVLGREPGMDELKSATWEKLVTDRVLKAVAKGEDPVAARGRATAALKKGGRHAALENLSELLALGSEDHSLDEHIGVNGNTTRASHLVAPDGQSEDALESLYLVALGDAQWARGVLAARFGVLGDVEGRSAIGADVEQRDLGGSRGVSVPGLSDMTGKSRGELREVLAGAVNRIGAPHAQWSHLAQLSSIHDRSIEFALDGFDRSAFLDE